MVRVRFLLSFCFLLVSLSAHAKDFTAFERTNIAIKALVEEHGLDEALVRSWMAHGRYHQRAVKHLAAPAEKTKTYAQYKPMFLSWDTIWQGRKFAAKYRNWLTLAEQKYGVPSEIIVAIIGIESRYGHSKGRHRTFDALGSLAVTEGRRADYFMREWVKFIVLVHEQGMDPLEMKGSYAGATGYAQFMPSSYQAYAVDLDGDNDIDIWHDPVDAIGSVANYLKQNGWKTGQPIISRARTTKANDDEISLNSFKRNRKLADIVAAGWQIESPYQTDWYVFPIRLETEEGPEYWLGYRNFWVISRYNRSVSYAMAVYHLAEEIVSEDKE